MSHYALVLTLFALLTLDATPAAADDAAFRTWVRARVAAEHLALCSWGSVDLDGDGTPEHFAWVTFGDCSSVHPVACCL